MRNLPIVKFGYFALFVAAVVFFLAIGRTALIDSRDFVPIYSGARCLVNGCNPYDTAQLERQYLEGHGKPSELPRWRDEVPVYPPSTFVVLFPFAYFSYPAARILWLLVNECLFIAAILAIILFWGKRAAAGSDCPRILFSGDVRGLSRGRPADRIFSRDAGHWNFALVQEQSTAARYGTAGVESGSKTADRRSHRAVPTVPRITPPLCPVCRSCAIAALLAGSFVLSSRPASAHWMADLRANAAQSLQPGQVNDPAPTNFETLRMINLQVLTSVFLPEPRIYNAATYLVVAIMFGVWAYGVVRRPSELATHAFAIAGLSIITLFPVYHRAYDARLLLISVPAILILLKVRRRLGFAVIAATVLSLVSFQYRTYLFLQHHPALQRPDN